MAKFYFSKDYDKSSNTNFPDKIISLSNVEKILGVY